MYEIKFSFSTFEELEAFNKKLMWMEENYSASLIAEEKITEEEKEKKAIPPISLDDALQQAKKAEPLSLTPQPGELDELPEKKPTGRTKVNKPKEPNLEYLRLLARTLIQVGYSKSVIRILKEMNTENLTTLSELKYSGCQAKMLEVFIAQRLQIPDNE